VIPTHRPMVRNDMADLVYRTLAEKDDAIVQDILDCHERGQPSLVGTISIDKSEHLSKMLKKLKIPHEVLNAKQHEREAQIVAEAGKPGAVTIATNMAGRGTDIVLGGNLELELVAAGDDAGKHEKIRREWEQRHQAVLDAGGLHVIGTERHESRRIDNQLRGRSGRQGDPGSSRFYLSMEDDLMRIFGSDRVSGLMQKLGMQEGEAIEHPWVSRAIANAQRKVEGRNFDIRKQLLEYDDVANDQRKVIYEQRNRLMEVDDISESISSLRFDVVHKVIDYSIPPQSLEEQWDIPALESSLEHEFGVVVPVGEWLKQDSAIDEQQIRDRVLEILEKEHEKKAQSVGQEVMRQFEKEVMLNVLDSQWKDHLAAMDHLRQGIHLRGYAAKNPKQEYKREAFELFSDMLERIKHDVISLLARVQIRSDEDIEALERQRRAQTEMEYVHQELGQDVREVEEYEAPIPVVRNEPKIGRNAPCPCGSGKKYKHCHGKLA